MQHVFGGDRKVRVRVVEARHDDPVAEIDDLGVREALAQSATVPVAATRSPSTANASGAAWFIVTIRRARKIVAIRCALPDGGRPVPGRSWR